MLHSLVWLLIEINILFGFLFDKPWNNFIYSSTSRWIITHYFVLFGKANQLKLKREVFFETSWLRTRKKMSNHFQPPISIKMVLELIIASKKWPFHSVKNHALISAIVVTKPSEKFSAEVSFLPTSKFNVKENCILDHNTIIARKTRRTRLFRIFNHCAGYPF